MKKVISPSGIISFYRNYDQWYQRYILGVEQEDTVYTVLGNAVHGFFEEFFKEGPVEGEDIKGFTTRKYNELIKSHVYTDELKAFLNENPVVSLEEVGDWISNYLKGWVAECVLLEEKYGTKNAYNYNSPAMVEEHLSDEELGVHGHVDAIYTEDKFTEDSGALSMFVVDYKTSKTRMSMVPKDYFVQSSVYSLLVEKHHGVQVSWICIHFIRNNHKYFHHVSEGFKESLKKFIKQTIFLMRTVHEDPDSYKDSPPYESNLLDELWR